MVSAGVGRNDNSGDLVWAWAGGQRGEVPGSQGATETQAVRSSADPLHGCELGRAREHGLSVNALTLRPCQLAGAEWHQLAGVSVELRAHVMWWPPLTEVGEVSGFTESLGPGSAGPAHGPAGAITV